MGRVSGGWAGTLRTGQRGAGRRLSRGACEDCAPSAGIWPGARPCMAGSEAAAARHRCPWRTFLCNGHGVRHMARAFLALGGYHPGSHVWPGHLDVIPEHRACRGGLAGQGKELRSHRPAHGAASRTHHDGGAIYDARCRFPFPAPAAIGHLREPRHLAARPRRHSGVPPGRPHYRRTHLALLCTPGIVARPPEVPQRANVAGER
jgi:hypothetical protein